MTELTIKMFPAGEMIVTPPLGGAPIEFDANRVANPEMVQAAIQAAYKRAEDFARMLADIGENPPKSALMELKKAAKTADDEARKFPQDFASAAAEMLGVKPLLVQLESKRGIAIDPICVRGKLRNLIAEIDTRLDALKPVEPLHSYVMQITTTDSALKRILKAAEREGAAVGAVVSPQNDRQQKIAEKFFSDNM